MAARFWVGGGATWDNSTTTHWSTSTGGAGGASVPGSSDDVTFDGASGGGTVTPNYNLTIKSLTMGAFTGTLDFSINNNNPTMATFSGTGTGVRTLNMGNGIWTLTGNNTTVWTTQVITNLTFNANSSTVKCNYSGSVGTRTWSSTNSITMNNLSITSGSDIFVTSTTTNIGGNLDFTGFTGSFSPGATVTNVGGNFTLGVNMTVVSGTASISFTSSLGCVITMNGVQYNRPMTINGTGTFTLGSNLDMTGASTRQFTVTKGAFNTNNFNIMCGMFVSSNSNVRSITLGTSTLTLNAVSAIVLNFSTATGLSFSGASATYIISDTSPSFAPSNVTVGNVQFTGTNPVILWNSSSVLCTSLSINGTGTLAFNGSWNVGTFAANQSSITMNLGTSGTITSNNQSFYNLTINKTAGVAMTLVDNLICTNTFILTQGNFSDGGMNIQSPTFNSSNTNTRVITMGGIWVLTGAGVVWDTSITTGLTIIPGTSLILLSNSSASTKTFSGGANTFNNIQFDGAGTGTFILGTSTSTMTFNNIAVADGLHTVQIFAGKTIIANSLTWSGTQGNLNVFQSTIPGTQWTISIASGIIAENFISLQDSVATGGATFYAGADSLNVSNNTGWIFGSVSVSGINAAVDQNNVSSIIVVEDTPALTIMALYANPVTHALKVDDSSGGNDFGPANAKFDDNQAYTLLAVSSSDSVTPVVLYGEPVAKSLLVNSN